MKPNSLTYPTDKLLVNSRVRFKPKTICPEISY